MACRRFEGEEGMTPGSPKEISVNETIILSSLDPRDKFFPTSICLTEGATYRFTASGKWKDLFILAGPDGWWCPILEQFIGWWLAIQLDQSHLATGLHAYSGSK